MSFDEDEVRRALAARGTAPSAEFRRRLSAALQDGRAAQDRMPRLAAVAAVVLAVAAVGALVFMRGAPPTPGAPPVIASPRATASASPEVVLPGHAILSAPSRDVVWGLVFGGLQPHLFRSVDQGRSWTERPLPHLAGQALEISFVSDREGWLSALSSPETQCNTQGIAIWHTTDAGATWVQLHVEGIAEGQCKSGLSFVDSGHGFVATYDPNGRALIYRTSDGGATWTASGRLADPPGFTSQAGGWFLQAGRVKRFGDLLLVPVTQSNPGAVHVYLSRDGGATWTYAATAPNGTEPPAFVTATRWLQVIVPGQSMETTDAGRTWHASASDYEQAAPIAPDVVFADDQVGYATVRGEIQLTTDGGEHWTAIQTPGT